MVQWFENVFDLQFAHRSSCNRVCEILNKSAPDQGFSETMHNSGSILPGCGSFPDSW